MSLYMYVSFQCFLKCQVLVYQKKYYHELLMQLNRTLNIPSSDKYIDIPVTVLFPRHIILTSYFL